MNHRCVNLLEIETCSAGTFTQIIAEIIRYYPSQIIWEEENAGTFKAEVIFNSEKSFPLNHFKAITKKASDPTLRIMAVITQRKGYVSSKCVYIRGKWYQREQINTLSGKSSPHLIKELASGLTSS